MLVEIIEFYPQSFDQERGSLTGTLRIKLCDSGIHILGIYVCKRKDSWFFNLPGGMSIHHETGERVRYPYLVFEDREKHRELMEEIREKGRDFIEKRLTDTEKPLVIPQKKQQQQNQAAEAQKLNGRIQPASEHQKKEKTDPIAKKTTSTEVKPIAKKIEWKDPPHRKMAAHIRGNTFAKR